MSEFVYQLNLPPITDMLLDGINENMLAPLARKADLGSFFIYESMLATSIIKPEYLNINGFEFTRAILFYKSKGKLGKIHRDTTDLSITAWGINWIYGGFGILEYWDEEDLVHAVVSAVETHLDAQGSPIKHYTSLVPARKKYVTTSPNAYLVNTTEIHRSTAWGGRWAISLRSNCNMPWDDIVEKFKNLIVCQNLYISSRTITWDHIENLRQKYVLL